MIWPTATFKPYVPRCARCNKYLPDRCICNGPSIEEKRMTVAPTLEAERAAFDYDPNITWAKQRVRVTLGQWDYRATVETTVDGNCKGFEIFDCAVSNAWEELPTRTTHGEQYAYVTLTRANGDELECEDDELNGEDWLKQMVIGIEVIGMEKQDDE